MALLLGWRLLMHEQFGEHASQVAVIVNDYTVLAGTQGYFHHRKIDRMLEQAKRAHICRWSCIPRAAVDDLVTQM